MCPASATQSPEVTNGDNLISKDSDRHNEDAMRARGEAKFARGLLRRLALNDNLSRLPLKEVGEEILSLGKIGGPLMITTLLLYSRSVICMLFLGHLGKIELAGGTLAIGFANITGHSILKGLAMGMDPICGQAYGAKRWSVVSQAYMKTLCLLLFVAIPISLLWLNVETLFLHLGQDPDITKIAKIYLVFSIPELIAQAFSIPMRCFLKAQGLTTPLTVAAIGAVIVHAPINYFLVMYLKLGVKGVALSLACNTINFNIVLLIYVAVSDNSLKPWRGITVPSMFQGWWPLLSLAVPSLISCCLEWWWYEIMLFLCGLVRNPKASVAATGILMQTAGVIYTFPFALSSSLSTRVSQSLGAGQPSRAQWTALIGICVAFTFGLIAFVFTIILRSVWGKLYSDEPQILHLTSIGLPILGLCEVFNSPQTAACGVLTGTARPKDGAYINLCSFYFVGLPVAILVTFKLQVGFQGLWFGLLSAQITCMFLMMYTMIRTDWKHQAKRAEELTSAAGNGEDDIETGLLSANQ